MVARLGGSEVARCASRAQGIVKQFKSTRDETLKPLGDAFQWEKTLGPGPGRAPLLWGAGPNVWGPPVVQWIWACLRVRQPVLGRAKLSRVPSSLWVVQVRKWVAARGPKNGCIC